MGATHAGEGRVSEVTPTSSTSFVARRLLDLPREERPRERLARLGAGALSSRELVSVLLGTGARGVSALALADELLGSGLRGARVAVACRSSSACAGWAGPRPPGCWPPSSWAPAWPPTRSGDPGPATARPTSARYLLPRYAARPVETFGLLALDVRHRLRREAVVSVGCLTASLVHPREVFQEAVVSRAAALVLFHNHPSGDPEPSAGGPGPHPSAGRGGDAHGHRGPRPPGARRGSLRQPEGEGRPVSRLVYFDCASGASGDMLLGAVVDLGLPLDLLRDELGKLPLAGYRLEAGRVSRSGLAATKVDVLVDAPETSHRHLGDILGLLEASALEAEVKDRAAALFQRLAEVEAAVHGTSPQSVHFHEVGAVDSIVDIVGGVIALRWLGADALRRPRP